ncbi:Coatomer subunit beta [Histomonas meleagridis]|uniref:Coatomer subunit beta n=1 Tax=Histomonas meleagridis TaxID=135588 RepID=UPI003559FF31|nr:Coatomer subunit beta [Histomonas meleagridis]KAH0797382.1 Coatomer subunit beta [Histomonas meleagridis]
MTKEEIYSSFFTQPKDAAPRWDEIEENIRNRNNPAIQAKGLGDLIRFQSSGDQPPDSVIMTVIMNVSTSQDHTLKKLMFLYYETVETRDNNGKLKQEYILITDALMKDLTHPNEYLRAAALRFASKFQEPELLGPLTSTICQSLHHKSAYVRRHAVVAIGRIHQKWPELAPDAPMDIAELLRTEEDFACKRVAFLVLCDISRNLATEFLDEIVSHSLLSLPQPMQLTATALIKSLCSDQKKSTYLPALTELLESPSPGVQLESALTLLQLTSTQTASKAGISTLCHIMSTIPNTTLQLSIADQIEKLIPTHTAVAQSMVSDFLSVLNAKPIRAKILSIVQKLTTSANVIEITNSLIRQIQNASSLRQSENEKSDAIKFMRLLLSSLRVIVASHPSAIKTVYEGISSFVVDSDSQLSFDTMVIIRETANSAPELRNAIVVQLENLLGNIRNQQSIRMALYLISLYTDSPESVDIIIDTFSSNKTNDEVIDTTTVVLEDGTYAQRINNEPIESVEQITDLILKEPFIISAICVSLARICCRIPEANAESATAFIKSIIVRSNVESEIERISFALMALSNRNDDYIKKILVNSSEEAFNSYISSQFSSIVIKPKLETVENRTTVDQPLGFSSILGKKFDPPARTITKIEQKKGILYQMTGTSDPIFCECRVIANKFDISLDFRLLNQTNVTLSNVKVELNCVGRLELIDRPAGLSLGPGCSENVKVSVKVTSAEAGRVFGTISYMVSEKRILPLAVLTVSTADYMEPIKIDQSEFRVKWEEFEWEKKVPIHSTIQSFKTLIEKIYNVAKLKPITDLEYDLPFLTANLYAKSYFGEEVLANVNVELSNDAINGFLRLRTDSQNMAISYSRLIQNIE